MKPCLKNKGHDCSIRMITSVTLDTQKVKDRHSQCIQLKMFHFTSSLTVLTGIAATIYHTLNGYVKSFVLFMWLKQSYVILTQFKVKWILLGKWRVSLALHAIPWLSMPILQIRYNHKNLDSSKEDKGRQFNYSASMSV